MCTTCGCAHGQIRLNGRPLVSAEIPPAAAVMSFRPVMAAQASAVSGHAHHHADHSHAPGISPEKRIQVEQDILAKNDLIAQRNRARFAAAKTFAVNLMSSPGSGKTTLLCNSIQAIGPQFPIFVIEGDQETSFDADRIRATGATAIQVNTGKGCHLDAQMVASAADDMGLPARGLLLIENVGNLVCPAGFDLGEAARVVILSVTEGEDKPLKYPEMFHGADLVVLNKSDLLPYVSFDVGRCVEFVHRVNPDVPVMQVSATRGDGMNAWLHWLAQGVLRANGGEAMQPSDLMLDSLRV